MKTDQLVAKYVELRDRRSALKKQYEEEDKKLTTFMERMEEMFHALLVESGETSKRTSAGTVFLTHKEYAGVADWDSIKEYIKENDAWGLVQRRISLTAVKEIMSVDANGKYRNPPPPGVNFVRKETVGVRR